MAKGNTAKQNVENTIREAFGQNFIGVQDKKLYVWADDGGEKVQVALTLTCPKTPIGISEDGMNFENGGNYGEPTQFKPAEITNQETENILKMMKDLGI